MTISQDSERGAEIRKSAFIGGGSLYFALNTLLYFVCEYLSRLAHYVNLEHTRRAW